MTEKEELKKFKKELRERNRHYREGEFEVIEVIDEGRVLTKNKFGECVSRYWDLLRGSNIGIKAAINKTKYFKKQLREENPEIYKQVEIISEYKGAKTKIRFKTKYGVIAATPEGIRKMKRIEKRSAENKKEFYLKEVEEKREDFENIDYSEYMDGGSKDRGVFRCKKHDLKYSQRRINHKIGHQGCALCMEQLIIYTDRSVENNKEFFKTYKSIFYVMRMTSEEEYFYKVGLSSRDRLSTRKKGLSTHYKVDVVYQEEGFLLDKYELEQRFIEEFKHCRYIPKKKFSGYTECLTVNPVEEYYQYFNKR